MGQGRPQDVPYVKVRSGFLGVIRRWKETHHDVRESTLGVNERGAVVLAFFQRGKDTLASVPTFIRIPLNFPANPQVLLRFEIDFDVVGLAHRTGRVTQQSFGDDIRFWLDVNGRVQGPAVVIVNRFKDRFPLA